MSKRFVAVDDESWLDAVRQAKAGDVITIPTGWGVIIKEPEQLPAVGVMIECPPPEDHDPKVTLSRPAVQDGEDWKEGWHMHNYGRFLIGDGWAGESPEPPGTAHINVEFASGLLFYED